MAPTPPTEPPPEPVAKEPPVEVKQPEVKQPEVKDPPVEVKQPEVKKTGVAKQPIKKDPKDQKIVPPGTGSDNTVVRVPDVKQPDPTATKSDAAAIAARYSAVGQKLKALGPAATELWPRYRLIRIQDVMSSPEKRAEAAQILGKLERDIAALPK
jgi:hypothetical protein